MTRDRLLVILPDSSAESLIVLERARRRHFRRFAAPPVDMPEGRDGEEWWASESGGLRRIGKGLEETLPIRPIASPQELESILPALRAGGRLLIRWKGERVLPLETLVALRKGPAEIWVIANRLEEVPGYLGALEHGAQTVAVRVDSAGQLDTLEQLLETAHEAPESELVGLSRVVPAGAGDRVIVDTTSLLAPEEGLWVGSVAAFLFHVTSEAVGSRYTRPRPFRVNAGAAHSYVLLANGETRYLSELEGGDALLISGPRGPSRSVRVGRVKVERRPMTLIEAERKDRRYTLFLQEAETVRVSGEHGPRAVTELVPGDRVYGAALPPGRHLGVAVAETVEER